MTLQSKHTALFLTLCAALTACKDNEVTIDVPTPEVPDAEKTPIELMVGGVDQILQTRTVITDGTDKTLIPFPDDVKVFMVMQSVYDVPDFAGSKDTKYTVTRGEVTGGQNDITFNQATQRYWDDAHARSSKLSIWAYAQAGSTNTSFKLGSETFDTSSRIAWRTNAVTLDNLVWTASTESSNSQNATTVKTQDLFFSNNLVDNSITGTKLGGQDLSLKFNFTDKHFPQKGQAEMKFYHAMSKITIHIVEGEGFDTESTEDFQFTDDNNGHTNVHLQGFNTKGVFSLKDGEFVKIYNKESDDVKDLKDIPSISLAATPAGVNTDGSNPNFYYYTLEALAIPNTYGVHDNTDDQYSRFVKEASALPANLMMEFTIDNSKYQISSGALYDALKDKENVSLKTDNGNYIPLEPGKNYVFTFVVGKTKIDKITAQVLDWVNVEAEKQYPTNARINLLLEERGTAIDAPADVYRATDNAKEIVDDHESYKWFTGYAFGADATDAQKDNKRNVYQNVLDGEGQPTTEWALKNNWYWPDNKHYYHFRAVMPSETDIVGDKDGDYIPLESAVSYTDYRWGAPMLDDKDDGHPGVPGTFKWTYGPTSNGFDGADEADFENGDKHQIYKAIGPTEDYLKLILFHLMSEVTFEITSNAGAESAVEIGKGPGDGTYTTIHLENYYPNGKALLGNGLVLTTGDKLGEKTVAGKISDKLYAPVSAASKTNQCTYGLVPQDLDGVQIRITTPDHNEYVVKLTDIKANSLPTTQNLTIPPYQKGTDGTYTIDRWYPGFKYHYKLVLSKKQVTILSATILDWEGVIEAEMGNIQIQ